MLLFSALNRRRSSATSLSFIMLLFSYTGLSVEDSILIKP